MAALGKIPQDSQPSSQAWSTLDGVIRTLRAAISDDTTPQAVLVMDQTLATWFPDALHGTLGDSVDGRPGAAPPRQSPPPARAPPLQPQAPVAPPPARSDSDRLTAVEEALRGLASIPAQLQALMDSTRRPSGRESRKRDRSTSRGSTSRSEAAASPRPSKSRRRSSGSSARTRQRPSSGSSSRTRPRTPSPTPHSSDEEVEEDSFSDSGSGSSDPTSPPSASRGWQPCPSYWVFETVDGVIVATDPDAAEEDQPNVRNEITAYVRGTVVQHYYRPRGKIRHLPPTQRDRANRISQSLASLSPWVRGGHGPCPSVSLAGYGRRSDGCEVSGVSLSPALSLASLPTVWSAAVAGDKTYGRDRDESRNDPRPLRQTWPEGSAEERAFTFLRESQSEHIIVPGRLVRPSNNSINKDRQARASAHRALQVSANAELLSHYLRAAETSDREWSSSDFKTFIAAAAATSEGISALLAPYTRDLVRAAVAQRVVLRKEAIPKDLASLEPSLLALDPLSPFIFAESEKVATLINSVPPPTTLEIKGLAQLNNLVKSSSHSKGHGHNKNNNHHSSGHKNHGSGGRDKDAHHGKSQGHSKSSNSRKPFHKSGGHNNQRQGNKNSSSSSSDDTKSSQKKN